MKTIIWEQQDLQPTGKPTVSKWTRFNSNEGQRVYVLGADLDFGLAEAGLDRSGVGGEVPAPDGMRVPPPAEVWATLPVWEWHTAGVDPRRIV